MAGWAAVESRDRDRGSWVGGGRFISFVRRGGGRAYVWAWGCAAEAGEGEGEGEWDARGQVGFQAAGQVAGRSRPQGLGVEAARPSLPRTAQAS